MAAEQFHCPHCSGEFRIYSAMAGQRIACPFCNQRVTLPGTKEAEPQSESSSPISPPSNPTTPPDTSSEPPLFPPSSIDPMLPPSVAAPPAPVDPMLPPSIAVPSSSPVDPMLPPSVDSLLPPTTDAVPKGETRVEMAGKAPMPSKASTAASSSSQNEDEAEPIVIPTEDGTLVTLHEPKKVVRYGNQTRELHRLTPEEKAHHRFVKNIIMAVFGMFILGIVAAILTFG